MCVRDLLDISKYKLNAPLYQRAYEWRQGQLNKLVADVTSLCELDGGNAPSVFLLGNIVLRVVQRTARIPASFIQMTGQPQAGGAAGHPQHQQQPALECDIIDGQQRLTTTVILLAVIHDMLLEDSATCNNRQRAQPFIDKARAIKTQLYDDHTTGVKLCVTPRVPTGKLQAFQAAFHFDMPVQGQQGLSANRTLGGRMETQ
jgi:hypothetical protein